MSPSEGSFLLGKVARGFNNVEDGKAPSKSLEEEVAPLKAKEYNHLQMYLVSNTSP